MSTPCDEKRRLEYYSTSIGILTIVAGLLVVIGWFFNVGILKSILPHIVEMKFNTALLFIATGLSLLVQKKSPSWPLFLLSGVTIIVAVLTGLQDLFNVDFGIDQLLMTEPEGAEYTKTLGRMSPLTGISFILLNIGLLSPFFNKTKNIYLCEVTLFLSFLIACSNLIGYLLNIKFIVILNFQMTPMALNTAVLFFMLGPAVLFINRDGPMIKILCSPRTSGNIIRRIFPIALVATIILNLSHIYLARFGILSEDISNSLDLILNIIYVFVFFIILLRELVQAEKQNEQAKEEREALLAREQKALEEAEQVNKAKDLFLATLSHELRTPLNAILGWAQLLNEGIFDQEKVKEAAEIIEQSARNQGQLINDLLDISRIIMGKLSLEKRPIGPAHFIQAALDAVRPMVELKSVRIKTQLEETRLCVIGDPVRLQQIVWNLLTNAIKFSPENAEIEVRTKILKQTKPKFIRIEVADQGQGIAPEFLPHLFESFSQADSSSVRKHGGLGLGLSIVKNLTELHGGEVAAESPGVGKGATFMVTLPLADSVITDTSEVVLSGLNTADRTKGKVKLTGIRLLLVDDDPPTCKVLTTFLKLQEADVSCARSAAEALQIFSQVRPDILVSDIAMPEEDGYSLIQKIRALPDAKERDVPAIALTAYAGEDDVRRAHAAGFQTHLSKPVEGERLAREILELIKATHRSGDIGGHITADNNRKSSGTL